LLFPPPTRTLFPYTPLFRSRRPFCIRGHVHAASSSRVVSGGTVMAGRADADQGPLVRLCPAPDRDQRHSAEPVMIPHPQILAARDRKSTRLNSSHDLNSYAV